MTIFCFIKYFLKIGFSYVNWWSSFSLNIHPFINTTNRPEAGI